MKDDYFAKTVFDDDFTVKECLAKVTEDVVNSVVTSRTSNINNNTTQTSKLSMVNTEGSERSLAFECNLVERVFIESSATGHDEKVVEDIIDHLLERSEQVLHDKEMQVVSSLHDAISETEAKETRDHKNGINFFPTKPASESESEEDSVVSEHSSPKHCQDLSRTENSTVPLAENTKKSMKRNRKLETDKTAIHSETQRLIRESAVSLPYHHPKPMSLKEFLNRRKSTPMFIRTPKSCSTPKENIKKPSHHERETLAAKVPDTKKDGTQTTTPLQELKQNLASFQKSLSLSSRCEMTKEPLIDLSAGMEPGGVQQLIDRFMKHASKLPTPVDPKLCALNIVSKETDSSGKEILKQEQITVKISPGGLQDLSTSGPKITELKSKLRSIISKKKMKEREKRLLVYQLDNEEGHEFEESIFNDENGDCKEKSKRRHSGSSSDEDNESMDDDLCDEEMEDEVESDDENSDVEETDEEEDDEIIARGTKKSKRCLFLDDEAEESGDDACAEESEDDDELCADTKEMDEVDAEEKITSEVSAKDESTKRNDDFTQQREHSEDDNLNQETYKMAGTELSKDHDTSFEFIGSLVPAAQPYGGERFKSSVLTESDSEEVRSPIPGNSFEEKLQEISTVKQSDMHTLNIARSDLNEGEGDENDLLAFCSGRFTGFTQKPSHSDQHSTQNEATQGADESSDDDSGLIIRRRIVKKPKIVLREEDNSSESNEENEELNFSDDDDDAIGKNKGIRRFFEEEAELSGSDVGSEDEEEVEGDNEYEDEGLTDELLNEDNLRDEIGKVHFKTMLDDDKKELRFFQEMYLEDGDLHSDGQGRERKFRWSNIDTSQDDDDDDRKRGSDAEEEKEDEDAEKWRVNRYEREKWLQEQKAIQISPSPKKTTSLNMKLVNRTFNKNPVTEVGKFKAADGTGGPRSFLFRNRQYFPHLTKKYNKVEDNDKVGKRATKNFVFMSTSPNKNIKPAVKRSLSAAIIPDSSKKAKTVPLTRSNSIFDLF